MSHVWNIRDEDWRNMTETNQILGELGQPPCSIEDFQMAGIIPWCLVCQDQGCGKCPVVTLQL